MQHFGPLCFTNKDRLDHCFISCTSPHLLSSSISTQICVSPRFRLKFKFRRGGLPPMMPLEFVGCIGGCDETLREVLDLKYLRTRGGGGDDPPALRPPRAEPPRAPSSNPRTSLPPVPSWTSQPRPPPGGGGVCVDNSSDAIVCNCGQDALLLTVRKDGPNQGRQFYKCNSGSCNFFLWADEPSQQGAPQRREPLRPAQRTPQPMRPSQGVGNMSRGGRGQEASAAGHTMCNCNETAVTRTVQKDGPNKGRTFDTCGKPRDQQCGFFQWADENVSTPGKAHTHPCSFFNHFFLWVTGELVLISSCYCVDSLQVHHKNTLRQMRQPFTLTHTEGQFLVIN